MLAESFLKNVLISKTIRVFPINLFHICTNTWCLVIQAEICQFDNVIGKNVQTLMAHRV